MLSAPTSTAPAASIRSISVASRVAGMRSRLIFEPARVARPATSNKFFTAKGTPASGPTVLPAAISASTARALARARSAVMSVKALRMVSCCLMRASAASVASSADILRLATALAISEAVISGLVVMAASDREHGRRLGLVRQREFVDEAAEPQRDLQIGANRRPPCFLDGQRQRFRDSVDIIVQQFGHHAPNNFLVRSLCLQRRMRDRRQQFLGVVVLRIAQDPLGRPFLDDSTRPHDNVTIAQQAHYVQIMRDEQITHT